MLVCVCNSPSTCQSEIHSCFHARSSKINRENRFDNEIKMHLVAHTNRDTPLATFRQGMKHGNDDPALEIFLFVAMCAGIACGATCREMHRHTQMHRQRIMHTNTHARGRQTLLSHSTQKKLLNASWHRSIEPIAFYRICLLPFQIRNINCFLQKKKCKNI